MLISFFFLGSNPGNVNNETPSGSVLEYDEEIDDYPPHEPILQPFEEQYEEEQKYEAERIKVHIYVSI